MKKIILITATVTLLAACSNKDKQAEDRQAAIDSVNNAYSHQRMLDSMTAASSNQDAMVIESPTFQPVSPEPEKKRTTSTPKKSSNPGTAKAPTSTTPGTTATTGTTTNDPNATAGTGTTTGTEEKKKKGLNNAAKGAIIGLGTGAAAGAVINKNNRGKGAVVGGVIGAVGGAVGGAVLDKRKAKKAKEAADSTNQK